MKIIMIIFIVTFLVACNKLESKKDVSATKTETVKKEVKKVENVKKFDIQKNCTLCHDLPKFTELEKSSIEKNLLNHRKLRRVKLSDKDFSLLVKRLKDMGK